eukprot:TRINITY_DN439_c0_g1_i1.p1 TRINITY_DN439_c0_g1~~TRINITY_DN439_c0_g1_i1.p1  ORF type:complete len:1562 (-),score=421.84 TRINITY_DN439_c0_g1_i1:218-4903(-)
MDGEGGGAAGGRDVDTTSIRYPVSKTRIEAYISEAESESGYSSTAWSTRAQGSDNDSWFDSMVEEQLPFLKTSGSLRARRGLPQERVRAEEFGEQLKGNVKHALPNFETGCNDTSSPSSSEQSCKAHAPPRPARPARPGHFSSDSEGSVVRPMRPLSSASEGSSSESSYAYRRLPPSPMPEALTMDMLPDSHLVKKQQHASRSNNADQCAPSTSPNSMPREMSDPMSTRSPVRTASVSQSASSVRPKKRANNHMSSTVAYPNRDRADSAPSLVKSASSVPIRKSSSSHRGRSATEASPISLISEQRRDPARSDSVRKMLGKQVSSSKLRLKRFVEGSDKGSLSDMMLPPPPSPPPMEVEDYHLTDVDGNDRFQIPEQSNTTTLSTNSAQKMSKPKYQRPYSPSFATSISNMAPLLSADQSNMSSSSSSSSVNPWKSGLASSGDLTAAIDSIGAPALASTSEKSETSVVNSNDDDDEECAVVVIPNILDSGCEGGDSDAERDEMAGKNESNGGGGAPPLSKAQSDPAVKKDSSSLRFNMDRNSVRLRKKRLEAVGNATFDAPITGFEFDRGYWEGLSVSQNTAERGSIDRTMTPLRSWLGENGIELKGMPSSMIGGDESARFSMSSPEKPPRSSENYKGTLRKKLGKTMQSLRMSAVEAKASGSLKAAASDDESPLLTETKLLEMFGSLDEIVEQFGFNKKMSKLRRWSFSTLDIQATKKSSSHKKKNRSFASFMERFLRMPNKYRMTWAEIFYHRMVYAQNVFSGVQMTVYERLCAAYLESMDSKERETRIYGQLAENLLEFCQTHRMDADGAVVGHRPREDIERAFISYVNETNHLFDGYGNRLYDLNPKLTSQDFLLRKIMTWGKMNDTEAIGRQVIAFAKQVQVREVTQLQRGDLAIALVGKHVQFVRFVGFHQNSDQKVYVHLTPDERNAHVVEAKHVLPLSKDIKDSLKTAKAMNNLVYDDVDEFYKEIKSEVELRFKHFLIQAGVDLELVDRCRINLVGLPELGKLEATITTLRNLLALENSSQNSFFEKVERFADNRINAFLGRRTSLLFMPNRSNALCDLDSSQFIAIARKKGEMAMETCHTALDQVVIYRREIRSGNRKAELAEWWLNRINDQTDEFLMGLGFDFTNVGEDYLDQPPSTMEPVFQNMQILLEVFDVVVDKHHLVEDLVNPLKEEVYSKISEYERSVKVVLSETFSADGWETSSATSLRERFALEVRSGMVRADDMLWIRELLADLDYLEEMRTLETTCLREDKAAISMTHVVPITGLIFGRIYRLENETRTVLQHWHSQDTVNTVNERQRKLISFFGSRGLPSATQQQLRTSHHPDRKSTVLTRMRAVASKRLHSGGSGSEKGYRSGGEVASPRSRKGSRAKEAPVINLPEPASAKLKTSQSPIFTGSSPPLTTGASPPLQSREYSHSFTQLPGLRPPAIFSDDIISPLASPLASPRRSLAIAVHAITDNAILDGDTGTISASTTSPKADPLCSAMTAAAIVTAAVHENLFNASCEAEEVEPITSGECSIRMKGPEKDIFLAEMNAYDDEAEVDGAVGTVVM